MVSVYNFYSKIFKFGGGGMVSEDEAVATSREGQRQMERIDSKFYKMKGGGEVHLPNSRFRCNADGIVKSCGCLMFGGGCCHDEEKG